MNHSVLYLSVIQFYLLNHTQNVISGRNIRIKLHWKPCLYGTPFATKFRQNLIGVCIQYKIDFWRSIFNNQFFTVDFRFTRERSLTIDLIIDSIFDNRFLIIDYWNSIFDNRLLKFNNHNRFLKIDYKNHNWLILASNIQAD